MRVYVCMHVREFVCVCMYWLHMEESCKADACLHSCTHPHMCARTNTHVHEHIQTFEEKNHAFKKKTHVEGEYAASHEQGKKYL
jgi:hypothetical protein